jgi:hypothetical protein
MDNPTKEDLIEQMTQIFDMVEDGVTKVRLFDQEETDIILETTKTFRKAIKEDNATQKVINSICAAINIGTVYGALITADIMSRTVVVIEPSGEPGGNDEQIH